MDNATLETPRVEQAEQPFVLGIASTDTMGGPLIGEDMGGFKTWGISQD